MQEPPAEDRNDEADQISIKFSDEEDTCDRYNSISEMLKKGRKALISGGHIRDVHKNLVKELHILGERTTSDSSVYNPDDELQCVLLDNWIEELLKFLALKTITGDNTEPCQLLPGHAVGVGWKVLMMTPTTYSRVCLAMGNQFIFDHNPLDTAEIRVQEKHKVKRYNATLRAYESYFEQQPPSLYWSFHKKSKDRDESLLSSILCGIDTSFILDPFATEQPKTQMMSPIMPGNDRSSLRI